MLPTAPLRDSCQFCFASLLVVSHPAIPESVYVPYIWCPILICKLMEVNNGWWRILNINVWQEPQTPSGLDRNSKWDRIQSMRCYQIHFLIMTLKTFIPTMKANNLEPYTIKHKRTSRIEKYALSCSSKTFQTGYKIHYLGISNIADWHQWLYHWSRYLQYFRHCLIPYNTQTNRLLLGVIDIPWINLWQKLLFSIAHWRLIPVTISLIHVTCKLTK